MNEDSARHAAAAGLSLEAENAQLRVENEQLLQQITRLALFVEEQTGRDPIPIMHGQSSTKAAPAAAAPAAATPAAAAPTPPPPQPPPPQQPPPPPPPSGWGSWLKNTLLGSDDDLGPPTQEVFEWVGDGDEDDDPGSAWSDGRLAAALLAARGVRECKLQGCGLATLPGAREVWEHLAPTTHTLALSGNALDDLPASVGALRGLKRLRLEGNLLRALPEAVVRLGALEELWLGCNQLSGLPDGFGALTRLRDLWLVSNEISYLPASFGELTSLRRLELSANALHDLPRSFAKLASLEELWLRSNALSAFPQQLCALEKLRVLDVAANAITTLPRAVAHMPALTTLELEGNPLVFPPAGLVSQGSAAVLDFVRGYRQSDLRSTESERSAREIVSSRDRLASSLSINGGGAPPQPGEEVDEVAAPAAADAPAEPDEPAAAPAAAPADEGAARREPPRKNRSYFD